MQQRHWLAGKFTRLKVYLNPILDIVTGKSILPTKLLLASNVPFLAGLGLSAVKKVSNKLGEVAMELLLAKLNLARGILLAEIKRLKAIAKRKLKAQHEQNRGANEQRTRARREIPPGRNLSLLLLRMRGALRVNRKFYHK